MKIYDSKDCYLFIADCLIFYYFPFFSYLPRPEWLVTVPLMVYTALATDNIPYLKRSDIIIFLISFLSILFGFLLNLKYLPVELGYVMFVLGCCILFIAMTACSVSKIIPQTGLLNGLEIASFQFECDRYFKRSKKNTLLCLYLIVFPLFPLVHVLAQCKVLSPQNTMIAYNVCAVVSKLLFGFYLTNSSTNIFTAIDTVRFILCKIYTCIYSFMLFICLLFVVVLV